MDEELRRRIAADLAPIEKALDDLRLFYGGEFHLAAAVSTPAEQLEPAEEAIAAGMTAHRRDSFQAGRAALRRALRAAGFLPSAVTADEDGVPRYPGGYVGSIAHKYGRAVAAICRSHSAAGIGIDLEFDEVLDEADLLANVATANEVLALRRADATSLQLVSPATLVLSAKEALYKAVFPALRTHFDFEDVELSLQLETRSFRSLRFPGHQHLAVVGHYAVEAGWIICVATAAR